MRRLMAFVAAGSLLAPTFAAAGDRYDQHPPGWARGAHYPVYYRGARHYHYPSRNYYYYYDHHHKGHGGDSDDAAWAIGGLVLGATLATVAASTREAEAAQESQPLPSLPRSARSSPATTRWPTTRLATPTWRVSATRTGAERGRCCRADQSPNA
jgi:hypothetical protein